MSAQNTEVEPELNSVQKQIIDAWLNTDKNIFCTGHGGTGKSWILRKLSAIVRSSGKRLALTAPTGAAAFGIGGVTLNKFAGIGIETENIGKMISMASTERNAVVWRSTDVLVIDEISMVSGIFFENLNLVAQSVRNSSLPFGGIRLFVLGDFLQLPPISKANFRPFRAFECEAWKKCNMMSFVLTETMRQTDPEFISNLLKIRLGVCDEQTNAYFESLSRTIEYTDGIEPVRLFALRKHVDIYNSARLNRIDFTLRSFRSIDTGAVSALVHCPAPQELHLKKGCQVMLIRNLSDSLVNGTIGVLTGFRTVNGERVPTVDVVHSDGSVKKILVNRAQWESKDIAGNVLATRLQFPLILAWAITIHKSQGKTIPRLSVDMAGVFEYGQAYVALSRCPSPQDLHVSNFSPDLVKVDAPCVTFHSELESSEREIVELPPSYTESNELQGNPATNVAEPTQLQWDNNTADTDMMLGQLSIQSDQESSGTLEFGSET
jgi:ATP-dependent DNA helicase PIF1